MRSTRLDVQSVPHVPEKIQSRSILLDFPFGQKAEVEEIVQITERRLSPPSDPIGGVVVAKPAFSLFDVGLEKKQGLSEILMPLLHQLSLLLNEGRDILQQLAPHGVGKLMEELAVPAEKPTGEHRGADRDIRSTHGERIPDGAGRAPEFPSRIPQPILQPLGHGRHIRRKLVSIQDQEIQIRMNRHLPTRKPTHRDDAEIVIQNATLHENTLFTQRKKTADQPIHEVGIALIDSPAGTGFTMQFGQVLAHKTQTFPHQAGDNPIRLGGIARKFIRADFHVGGCVQRVFSSRRVDAVRWRPWFR